MANAMTLMRHLDRVRVAERTFALSPKYFDAQRRADTLWVRIKYGQR